MKVSQHADEFRKNTASVLREYEQKYVKWKAN